MRLRIALRLLVTIPLSGVVIASILSAGWLVLGSPTVARGTTWFSITKVGDSEFIGAPDQPFFTLVLGNDSRSISEDTGLGDAIHVIGVNPATGQASILNVPRDTEAPGGGKINAFNSNGGLPAMVEQLNRMMGIEIKYAITTNFTGFMAMVDEIGGIDIDVPPVTEGDGKWNDDNTGAFFEPGPQKFNGSQALAFSRDRYDFETTGDVTRSANQARLIIAALATLRAQNPGDTGTLKLAATLARHVTTQNLSLSEIYRLGRLALTVDPTVIKNLTIPVGGGSGTNLSVGAGASELFSDFADDATLQNH